MRILNRYIIREVLRHTFLGFVIFTFVLFVPQLVKLMALLVRHSGTGLQTLQLFLCIFPGVFTFAIPVAVLIGVLLGLGRMSADSEIIALTALGIGRACILLPVGILASVGAALTLLMTLWLGPLALRTLHNLEATLLTSQVNFQVQPRVFDERFPRLVLYINDVSASGTQWRGVFLAEAAGENGARVTLAEKAIVIAAPKQGKLELHLQGGTTHEFERATPDRYSVTAFGQSDWPIEVSALVPVETRRLSEPERTTGELLREGGPNWREARVELHRRFAFPVACLAFALIAVPLGAQPRRGGRAAGSLIALLLSAAYYLAFITGAGLARQGVIAPAAGLWAANFFLTLIGLVLLPRMEQFRGESRWLRRFGQIRKRIRTVWRKKIRARARVAPANSRATGETTLFSSGSFPRLIDMYVLRCFLYYFGLLMVIFVFLFEAFTFFELLDDIARHRVAFLVVTDYFGYLTPYLLYQLAPLAGLVAILVTVGVMSKNNETVACKASGISLYRLAIPLLAAGVLLAGTMLLLDETFLPYANQRQDALRNQIKGRPAQTYKQPERWILGESQKIYNYDVFQPGQQLLGGLSVLELDPATFQIRRRIFASRAHWSDTDQHWVLESGWVREFSGNSVLSYERFANRTFSELSEPPSYFNREVRQAFQMDWTELRRYIDGLQRAGFDASVLTVQWHRKLAFPLIAPISMLLAFPFAFLVGTRGAIGGVAMGVAIAILYWLGAELLAAMGGVGQLPPLLAGWSPDIVFFFLGLYLYFRMPT